MCARLKQVCARVRALRSAMAQSEGNEWQDETWGFSVGAYLCRMAPLSSAWQQNNVKVAAINDEIA